MNETKEKPRSKLPGDFDWTAHHYHKGKPTKALCGVELLGIPSPDSPICKECQRIRRERLNKGG